jgi:hypothetical protein
MADKGRLPAVGIQLDSSPCGAFGPTRSSFCLRQCDSLKADGPRVLQNGETIDLGEGKRVRYLATYSPWLGGGVLYEETTGTLLCGDPFTQLGDGPALTEGDIVRPVGRLLDYLEIWPNTSGPIG